MTHTVEHMIVVFCFALIITLMISVSLHFIWRILSHYSTDTDDNDSKEL